MKINCKPLAPVVGLLVAALGLAPGLKAECGGVDRLLRHPTAMPSGAAPARLVRASFLADDDGTPLPSIVGMWHVKFIAMGNQGIPDKTEIDAGYSQWHGDGTEITNSGGRAPSTSSFCLGVWERTAPLKYELNHLAISWDPTPSTADPDGVIVGPANIRESVTLSANGQSFAGTFVITQYDETLNVLAEVKGNIKGTRITASTPPSSVF